MAARAGASFRMRLTEADVISMDLVGKLSGANRAATATDIAGRRMARGLEWCEEQRQKGTVRDGGKIGGEN